jgi:NAD(P)-dependent dehydrogenase (short-subunit alcohol dehydrogenase family)
MKRVENKVIIVTGGALGIGKETSVLLAKEGAKIAITDVLDKEGEKLAHEINESGGTAKFWHLDVTNEKEVEKVYADVVKEYGKLDASVNNAGISGADKPTHELTEKEWEAVMNVNVKGVFFCTKYAVQQMLKNGSGSIINLSSIYGLIGAGDAPPYHASKGAVRLMTKNDAITYAKNNIRINSVHPGFILTPMVKNFAKDTPEVLEYLTSLHPLGHLGEPLDIAYA